MVTTDGIVGVAVNAWNIPCSVDPLMSFRTTQSEVKADLFIVSKCGRIFVKLDAHISSLFKLIFPFLTL